MSTIRCTAALFDQITCATRFSQGSLKFLKSQSLNSTLQHKTPKQYFILVKRDHMNEFQRSRKQKILNKIFGKYLLLTNTISSGLLMIFGDLSSQTIENQKKKRMGKVIVDESIDFRRAGRMFIVGALLGPLNHVVYNWMDRIMPIPTFKNICKKLFIDQVFMSPACVCIFFYGACFLERKSFQKTNEELKSKFFKIMMTDWMFWPGVQYLNFRYLSTKYRVVFVNVATALYNIFLSYMKHDYDEDIARIQKNP